MHIPFDNFVSSRQPRSPLRTSACNRFRFRVLLLMIALALPSAAQTTRTWVGSGSFVNAGNWNPGGTPALGDHLVFREFGSRGQIYHDGNPTLAYGSISIQVSGYEFTGNQLMVSGGITSTPAAGMTRFLSPVVLSGNQTVSRVIAQAGLAITGSPQVILSNATISSLSGSGSLRIEDSVTISGGSYSGSVSLTKTGASLVVAGGTLLSPVTLASSHAGVDVSATILAGTGTVGNVSLSSAAGTTTGHGLSAHATLKPGGGVAGLFTTGDASFGAHSALEIQLNGGTPGAGGHDQLLVNGTVALGPTAFLRLVRGSYLVSPGQQFVILSNDGTDPVNGTFAGLPEGGVVGAGGDWFEITYQGGTGNDIVLEVLPPSPVVTRVMPAAGPATGGTRVMVIGRNFDTQPGATIVRFGAAEGSDVRCSSPTTCSVLTPPGTGTVDVTVEIGGISSASDPAPDFEYAPLRSCDLPAFANPVTYSADGSEYGAWPGDFNEDGDPDLAVPSGSAVAIFMGQSAAAFAPPVAYNTGPNASAAAVGDLDSDGHLDVVVSFANGVARLLGYGDGTFAPAVSTATGVDAGGITLGDFNGDQRTDVAVANFSTETVSLLLGDGAGGLAAPVQISVGGSPWGLDSGDVDGDGDLDIVAGLWETEGSFVVLTGNGSGSFTVETPIAVANPVTGALLLDVDGDGDLDVATSSSGGVTVFRNDGPPAFEVLASSTTGSSPQTLVAGDMNSDGVTDLIAPNLGVSGVTIVFLDPAGNIVRTQTVASGNYPRGARAADFDGDGRLDLAIANSGASTLTIHRSDACVPQVTSVSPSTGAAGGGTAVTIGGLNFDTAPGATAIHFGAAEASGVSCVTTQQCTATSASGTGVVSVRATVSGVTSADTAADNFTYDNPRLSVSRSGAGSGTVSGAGINCGSDCTEAYAPGAEVSLTASAAAGSSFNGWSGACTGAAACSVTMSTDRAVTADFTVNVYDLTVTTNGNGTGTVTSNPGAIECGSTCMESYTHGTLVTLTPAPATGSTFSGWSGACTGSGSCVVTMDQARSVTATFTLARYTLTVALDGTGGGTVTSAPAGISCHGDCSESYDYGTVVTLTGAPGAESTFTGWLSYCTGNEPCQIVVDQDITVRAVFDIKRHSLTVTKDGTGSGTVSSSPSGIECGSDCDQTYNHGAQITLTPMAEAGSTFASWSGACTGSGACAVTMADAKSVTATFQISTYALLVSKNGNGSGTVTSSPSGVNCGSDCSETYDHGTLVTLTPTAGPESIFASWSGACTGSGACVVTMDAAKSVTATFARTWELSVSKSGTGFGTVTSSPAGIDCGSDCGQVYAHGTVVTLTAVPAPGSVFAGWTHCDTSSPCTVEMIASRPVIATFNRMTLSVVRKGGGTISGSGIDCGNDCSEIFDSGTEVTLSATPMPGHTFAGWTGSCTGTGPCTVVMSASRSVQADFPEADGCPSFATRVSYGMGSGTIAMAAADLNTDGLLDLITAGEGWVVVRRGTGGGSFGALANYRVVGLNASSIQTGDINGDARPDVVIASWNGGLRVLTANPDGTLAGPLDLPSNMPTRVRIADWDNDGIPDLIHSNWTANTVSWSRGMGAGTFATPVVLFSQPNPYGMVVGDFDGNGVLDVATSKTSTAPGTEAITIRLMASSSAILATQTVLTPVWRIETGDLDNDGDLDLVATNENKEIITVLGNDGSGTFSIVQNIQGFRSWDFSLGDLDRDGYLDVASAAYSNSSVLVAMGAGDGTLRPPYWWSTAVGAYGLAVGDLDGNLTIDIAVAGGSTASVHLNACPAPQRELVVSRAGNGTGVITSTPLGIDCGSGCNETYDHGARVTLTATPAGGSSFGSWSGACSGSDACVVTMDAAKSVTATFMLNTYALSVSKNGTGSGAVASSPSGIDCGSDCAETYTFGTEVTLTPTAATGSTFTSWSGACTGSGACVVTMDVAKNVTATFTLNTYELTVTKSSSGEGTITSSPAGIDCGSDCTHNYDYGTDVTLTAAPTDLSTFTGWSGACSGTGNCSVTMDEAKSVTASFAWQSFEVTQKGILAGGDDAPLEAASVELKFRIHQQSTGGIPLWESVHVVPVSNGYVSIDLGDTCCGPSLTGETFAGGQRYLEVVVNGTTLAPRLVITPAVAASGGMTNDTYQFFAGSVPVATGTSLQASAGTSVVGTPVTFTATVTGDGQETGDVTFTRNSGAQVLGTASLVNGTAQLTTSSLPPGSHSVTAQYSGESHVVFDNGSRVGYSLHLSSTSQAVLHEVSSTSFALSVSVTGKGTVTSSPAGIDCGSDCSESYGWGTEVTLTAVPLAGGKFTGWSGACSGTGTCTVHMTEARDVTATFSGLSFHTLAPCRVYDSRTAGSAFAAGVKRIIQVGGVCGVPATARSVAVNVTVVTPPAAGHLTVFPGDAAMPGTSTINFSGGKTRANNAVISLAGNGSGTIAVVPALVGGGSVHALIDVSGYFE